MVSKRTYTNNTAKENQYAHRYAHIIPQIYSNDPIHTYDWLLITAN